MAHQQPLQGEIFIYSSEKRLAAFRVAEGTGRTINSSSSSSSNRKPSATGSDYYQPPQNRDRRRKEERGGREGEEEGAEGEGGGGKAGRRGGVGGGIRGHAIFVAGLTDGLLACDYIPRLAAGLDRVGYSLVQPILSSSYKGYGTSSLHQDVEELDELLAYLSSEGSIPSGASSAPSCSSAAASTASSHAPSPEAPSASPPPTEGENPAENSPAFLLIGHSTGCQDAVFYMKHGRPELRAMVRGVVLQAPVSDREYLATQPGTEGLIAVAKATGEDELMPIETDEAPITASRFLSLATKEGDDDMFSSDLSPDERYARLGHMASVPTAAFISGADQYMPPDVSGPSEDKEPLADKFRATLQARPKTSATTAATTSATTTASLVHVIDGADHALSDENHAQDFVAEVEAFVANLNG